MKPVVMSLGGSLIVQESIDHNFIKQFKKLISKINRKFVIVVGGGRTARIYINALAKEKVDKWAEFYNQERPHQTLGYETPNRFYDKQYNFSLRKIA